MRDLIVRPAMPGDLRGLVPDEDLPAMEHLVLNSRAFTALGDNGDHVFTAGIALINAGTGEAWNRPGPCFREYLAAPRELRALLARESQGLRRVQACVIQAPDAPIRFWLWLGFEAETILQDYGPAGEPCIIFRYRG